MHKSEFQKQSTIKKKNAVDSGRQLEKVKVDAIVAATVSTGKNALERHSYMESYRVDVNRRLHILCTSIRLETVLRAHLIRFVRSLP